MKALTLISVLVCAMGLNSCCCQSQSMPPLRPMPKNLVDDTPVQVEPVKVIDYKGK